MKSEFCISVAKNPGRFGETVHNAGYKALGLNFQYKAFSSNNIFGVIKGVKALGIRGCSISMPFKEKVIKFWIEQKLPVSKISLDTNTIKLNVTQLSNIKFDELLLQQLEIIKTKSTKLHKKKLY